LKDFQFQYRTQEEIDTVDSYEVIVVVDKTKKSENKTTEPQILGVYLNDENINPEFRDLLLNKKVGDKFETALEPTLDDKNINNDSKPVYEYEIKKILKVKLPEINEEFIKKITNNENETFETFKEKILKDELQYLTSEEEKAFIRKLKDVLVEKFKVTPPPSMVEKTVKDYVKDLKTIETYKNVSDDQLSELVKPLAEKNVIWFIIKKSLVKQSGLDLTEEEINNYAQKLSEKYKLPVEQAKNYLVTRGANLLEELLEEKIFNFLKPKVKITTKKEVL